ncbi:hypothetical protein IQ07DRAFT_567878 [Pyrenochaeta sp. DS3sAY3a]|nr:hypothetical protein IQ07DRAFT_567878 [Pyrenochaeta sp. DS3sAY3a]
MSDQLCGVCNTAPKKYKCPTCALPYCSLPCFKLHKPTHPPPSEASQTQPQQPQATTTTLPQPQPTHPAPAPPSYLKRKRDFSPLLTNPALQTLLKTQPALLPLLQRIYACTIEPSPEDEARRRRHDTSFRRGRGRGRGGRAGRARDEGRKWTAKKGDADAMGVLKRVREGKGEDGEREALGEFGEVVRGLFEGREGEAG